MSIMAEELFFHYTSKKAATQIVLEGKIRPSITADREFFHGDVYLTTLEPKYGLQAIMNNNWDGAARNREKMETYFEFWLPSSEVKRAKEKRHSSL